MLPSRTQASPSVLDCDLIIAPVHLKLHWTCAMANLRDQEIVYLDSMGVRPNHFNDLDPLGKPRTSKACTCWSRDQEILYLDSMVVHPILLK